MSPRDAEFVAGLRLALEDIARSLAYRLISLGVNEPMRTFRRPCGPCGQTACNRRGDSLQQELTEQLLPMFGVQTDVLEFDFDDVEELQNRNRWHGREREQIEVGVIRATNGAMSRA